MITANQDKILSKKREDLTIKELRSFPGLENLSDEQATHIIAGLKELSILLCYAAQKQQSLKDTSCDNQPIIRKLEYLKAA
jgi:hypothetical protein